VIKQLPVHNVSTAITSAINWAKTGSHPVVT